jgi:hypothetical protein
MIPVSAKTYQRLIELGFIAPPTEAEKRANRKANKELAQRLSEALSQAEPRKNARGRQS